MTLSGTLIKSTIVAALGGLLFGFDTAVISGTLEALKTVFHLTEGGKGFTVAIAVIGTVFGSLFAGIPGDRYGRRDSLRGMAVLYLVSAVGCAFAWDWYSLLFFRLIGGLGIGGSSVLGPMYIAEIAPAKWRGRLVGFFQFNVVAGILVAYLSNYVIRTFNLGLQDWRWMLGVTALPAVFFLLMLFLIPRSPRWLVKKSRLGEARQTLVAIGEDNVEKELADIVQSVDVEHGHGQESLFQAKYGKPIFLAVAIGMFNQLSGINALLYYINQIFNDAGFAGVSGDRQAVIIGFTNLCFTMLAMTIIDKVGRKTLLLIGSVGCAVALGGAAYIFLSEQHKALLLWMLILFIASFAFSQGAVIWVYLSEVFPTRVRAQGQSLGSFTHWAMNATIVQLFPIIAAKSKGLPFVVFAVMMVVQFFVVLLTFPETKGVTLEDMQRKFGLT